MCWSSYHRSRYEARRRPARRPVSDPVTVPGDTRVSDTERNRVIEVLKRHTADGRLTFEEFEARVDETLAARTGSDLRMVLRDLPVSDRDRPGPRPTLPVAASMWLPVIALVVVLTWVVAGHLLLWPLFLVAFFWFRMGGGRHRRARWGYDRPERTQAEDTTTYV